MSQSDDGASAGDGGSPYLSFDRYAAVYDRTRVASPVVARALAAACEGVGRAGRAGTIVDAGVGTGRYAAPLARRFGARVVGVDISMPMMRQVAGKDGGAAVRLVRGDLRRLPLRTASARVAVAIHIVHLIEDWRGVVREIRRVLEPGGVLLLGAEGGGRSVLVDYYLDLARATGKTLAPIGARGLESALADLRSLPDAPSIERVESAGRSFKRRLTVRETLDTLDQRPYSELRTLPDAIHNDLMAQTRAHAARTFPSLEAVESRDARFVLYAVRWS